MFLQAVLVRNPELVEWSIWAHQRGDIEPDSYVIDVDRVEQNAAALAQAGANHRVRLLQVMKQHGRNPALVQAIAAHIPAVAAIDLREVEVARRVGVRLGNVGHLVQIPLRNLPQVLAAGADYVTVYDVANLRAVQAAAAALGRVQEVLVKVACDPQAVYPGQEGGFEPTDIAGLLDEALPNVSIAGLTAFPCVLFDEATGVPVATSTMKRVETAANQMRARGIDPVLNLPSHTSVASLGLIARLGGTLAEPGHALTGTTPHHARDMSLAEVPALVYVSQVAQVRKPSLFGGGFYSRGHAAGVLLAGADGKRTQGRLRAQPAENIDYYRGFEAEGPIQLGDTALMAFRTQIFVTRSRVCLVSGLASGRPVLAGHFDAQGRPA